MSVNQAAHELNKRGASSRHEGGQWHAATVIPLRERINEAS